MAIRSRAAHDLDKALAGRSRALAASWLAATVREALLRTDHFAELHRRPVPDLPQCGIRQPELQRKRGFE